jgi:hypothetical protein
MGYPPIRSVMSNRTSEEFLSGINVSPEAISEVVAHALEVVAEAKADMTGKKAA